mmetsp:Transcript_29949/g.63074  ORF Transcript_29949/g.63074 Transcript_29949/m.63074 type:complete len:1665 (-) Transcript_29949:98-5092(-)
MSIIPNEKDVLFGRGFAIMSHQGNQLLRSMVQEQKPKFLESKRASKREIAYNIVKDINKSGGRFLIESPNSAGMATSTLSEKSWAIVDTDKAVDKVMHRFREKAKERGKPSRTKIPDKKTSHSSSSTPIQNSTPENVASCHDDGALGEWSESNPPFASDVLARAVENKANAPPVGLAVSLENQNLPMNQTNNIMQKGNGFSSEMMLQHIQSPATVSYQPFQPASNNEHQNLIRNDAPGALSNSPHCTSLVNSQLQKNGIYTSSQQISSSLPQNLSSDLPFFDHSGSPAPTISSNSSIADVSVVISGQGMNGVCEARESGEVGMFFYLIGAMDLEGRFPLSVTEFLKTGCLSNHMVLLKHEDEETSTQESYNESKQQQRKNILVNATRLSLLAAHLFVKCRTNNVDLTTIRLDDFLIDLVKGPTNGYGEIPGPNILSNGVGTDNTPQGWGILQMRLVSRARGNNTHHVETLDPTPAVQTLGKLLYSIFSLGEPPSSDIFTTELRPYAQESTRDSFSLGDSQRSSKAFRSPERSVFSRLIELDMFPVSLCRFLSDMIDSGPNGNAEMELKSFEDVVHELERMASQPSTYLHDAFPLHGQPQLNFFGQSYCGREAEVTCLKNIVNQMEQSSHQANMDSANARIEAVFVSGIAGTGKSRFVRAVGDTLGPGWTIIRAKFERGKQHASRRMLSSMFDHLVVNLVNMKESGISSDVAYSRKVSKSILDNIGYDDLSSLVDFLPSLCRLFDGLRRNQTRPMQAEDNEYQLIFSISKIIEAVLESDTGRLIMICCDDLQWGDQTSLSLISEILVNIGSFKDVCSRCLFIGLFRDDEVDANHPFSIQYSYIQMMTNNINSTNIKLPSLSKKDVGDMLMAEFCLPRRYIAHMAEVVHKKTSGHALFVVELLNSLIRDSIITYSPQTRSYIWDHDAINLLQTGDGVAGLIALNLKSLPPNSQRVLQLLSCFGMQTEIALLKYLESFQSGIICSLDTFIEMGILDQAGSILMFTHDMIQQEIYESASLAEREALHLKIGECLGKQALIDKPATIEQMVSGLDELQLADEEFFAGKSMFSSLISIACDQIDCAGPSSISDEGQRTRFAAWNLASGKQAQSQSNSLAALYYFSKGIIFLKPSCWHKNNMSLCLALHKGALKAAFTLGKADSVAQYAKEVESHVTFEDSLEIQPFFLMSLSQSGQHEEAICRGIEILRRLNFDIPVAPTPEAVMEAIIATDNIASNFSMDQLVNLCEKAIDDSVHYAFKIIDAFYSSCYVSSSPFLPLVVCAVMQFSFQHGISHTATGPFATFGALKIFIAQDYDSARKWSTVVRALEQKHESMVKNKLNMVTHAYLFLHVSIDIWFQPPMEIAKNLEMHHRKAMRLGQVHIAMCALGMSCRYKLLGGENLSLFTLSYNDHFRLVAKHSGFVARHMLLDSFLLQELTGKSRDYFSLFDGSICSMNDLQDEAKETKDLALLQCSYVFNVIIEYWKGNFLNAEEHSQIASTMFPACKEPTIYLIYHTLFRALVLFKLHRTSEDNHNERLKSGKEMLDAMEAWAQFSVDVFESKWKLLNAEYYASVKDFDQAVHMYKSSIKAAQDHGNIHELALGHELMGNYYFDHGLPDSTECFKKAYIYYSQWGATAIADKLLHKHDLEVESSADQGVHLQAQKHSREWD